MSIGTGDHGRLAGSQAIGGQGIDHGLRDCYQGGPGEIPRINRVPPEKPPHVKLQCNGLGDPDRVQERRQHTDLADAAQVQQYRGIAHDGLTRHRTVFCAGHDRP